MPPTEGVALSSCACAKAAAAAKSESERQAILMIDWRIHFPP